ncbi:hypothetical protein LCGC14_1413620 [marine sediment metagenome]|uniref:Uncharacterized protein n=1 Tax=marine sediment metagenome TaxID=412755 RepID=A0A0F9JTV5_9ZZZZ
MAMEERPDKGLADIMRTGIETFKSVVEGVTSVIRQGDYTLKDLDSALTGGPSPESSNPEQSFLEVVALMQAALEEARQKGTATNPAVVQRAREILGKVTKAEPAWRPAPTMMRTINDIIRMSLRDLRGSQNLIRLAQGTGTLDDLDSLTKWADEISDRVGKTQQVIAEPKPSVTPSEPATAPQQSVLVPVPVAKKETTAKKKRDTTPKKKANPEDIAFAQAVAEEMGDNKVKGWAQEFADGKLSEKQWVSRLTNHAAATRESLDSVFARATERTAKEAHGK